IERPIQIGDIVEVDGVQGQVERIGPRSTRIKTFESTHLILPNSAFLERRVINLTLADDVVRGVVEVGVTYGCDTRLVQKLMMRVLEQHPEVLEDPEPSVALESFGESALLFRAYFWVPDVLRRGTVASDVRFQIDDLFREEGIVLAYPQRDVHLGARE